MIFCENCETFQNIYFSEQKQPFLKICDKFTGQYPCRSVIWIKLLCSFIKIAFWQGCSVTPFPKNTSEGLLLIEPRWSVTSETSYSFQIIKKFKRVKLSIWIVMGNIWPELKMSSKLSAISENSCSWNTIKFHSSGFIHMIQFLIFQPQELELY